MNYSILTKIGLFDWGLRMESAKFKYYLNNIYVSEQSQSTTKFFPRFSWGIRVGTLQAQLVYSTSINRPTYRQLSSNTVYGSRYTYQTGNPLLRPEYTHELTLQVLYSSKQPTLTFATLSSTGQPNMNLSLQFLLCLTRTYRPLSRYVLLWYYHEHLIFGIHN